MSNRIPADQVSPERWRAAQSWEAHHWVDAQKARARFGKNHLWRLLSLFGVVPKYRGDDWNKWWMERFDNYEFLPPTVNNALEVGCGPYTNMRLIMERCRPEHLVLSDPLIRTYVTFQLTFVADMHRKAAAILDDHPLEELPFADDYFDLVVMINVLDHVRDAHQCVKNLIRVCRPGGVAVVGQDLSSPETFARHAHEAEDVGHPIALSAGWFESYLPTHFQPIVHKVLRCEDARSQEYHSGTLIFAGLKKS